MHSLRLFLLTRELRACVQRSLRFGNHFSNLYMERNLTYIQYLPRGRALAPIERRRSAGVSAGSRCVLRVALPRSLQHKRFTTRAGASLAAATRSSYVRLVHATCGDRVDHLCGTAVACVHMICITSIEQHGAESCYLARCGSAAAQVFVGAGT